MGRCQSTESEVRVNTEEENDMHLVPLSAPSGDINHSDYEWSIAHPPVSSSGVEKEKKTPKTPKLYKDGIK